MSANEKGPKMPPRGEVRYVTGGRSYGSEAEGHENAKPLISLVDGISPFGPPPLWQRTQLDILQSPEGRRAMETYWTPGVDAAKKQIMARYGLDDDSCVVPNARTGVDGLLRTSLILIPRKTVRGPRIAQVGPYYPGYRNQMTVVGGVTPYPYSPSIEMTADEGILSIIEKHEKDPIPFTNLYFSRVDFKGDVVSREVALKAVKHFTDAGIQVDLDEVGLEAVATEKSLAKETQTNPRLRVYSDASKVLGVPGLGFGFVITNNSLGPIFERAMGDRYIRGVDALLLNAFWQNAHIQPHLEAVRPKIKHAKGTLTQELKRLGVKILPTDERTTTLVVDGIEPGLANATRKAGLILAGGGGYDKTSEPSLSTQHVRIVISETDRMNREVAQRVGIAVRANLRDKTPTRKR